jgi:hypothetical protein
MTFSHGCCWAALLSIGMADSNDVYGGGQPGARRPGALLMLGIRDEFVGRPWQPPARHWPGSPLIGGLDEQAGGTWLAVHPELPRASSS